MFPLLSIQFDLVVLIRCSLARLLLQKTDALDERVHFAKSLIKSVGAPTTINQTN